MTNFYDVFTEIIGGNAPDDWSIYLPDKESAGIIDFGGGALAEGVNTKSTNIGSHSEGIQTHAYGQYSHTEGFKTKSGYAAHAEGRETSATGEQSHTEGKNSTASGNCSHAEGRNSTASGKCSHAEGDHTTATHTAEHASGKYNRSNTLTDTLGTIFSVGVGTSNDDMQNAFEILNDDRIYIKGIGGYDGTSPLNKRDLATDLEYYFNTVNPILVEFRDRLDIIEEKLGIN